MKIYLAFAKMTSQERLGTVLSCSLFLGKQAFYIALQTAFKLAQYSSVKALHR